MAKGRTRTGFSDASMGDLRQAIQIFDRSGCNWLVRINHRSLVHAPLCGATYCRQLCSFRRCVVILLIEQLPCPHDFSRIDFPRAVNPSCVDVMPLAVSNHDQAPPGQFLESWERVARRPLRMNHLPQISRGFLKSPGSRYTVRIAMPISR